MRGLRALLQCQRGGSAAELALLLPLLTVLLFGGLELGYYFYNEHQVIKGVRDGARYASRLSFADLNCASGSPDTSGLSAVTPEIQEVTSTGEIANGTPRVPGWLPSDVTVTLSCVAKGTDVSGIYAKQAAAPVVTVSATVPYKSLFGGMGILNNGYILQAKQESAVMGI